MIELEISAASRVGCVRHNNQDMILVGDHFIREEEYRTHMTLNENSRCILAVADGMGGHRRGEVASSDTLHNLQFFFNDIPSGLDISAFNESIVGWLDSINCILDSKGKADGEYKGMGTTLVAFAYYEGEFYSMNCGDSRLYRFRDGSYIDLVQLTPDVQVGDIYLLCSDGLTDMMSDHRLAILLSEGADADILCNAAIERGGFDNVSVCLINIKKL